jgi:hypothetical protein
LPHRVTRRSIMQKVRRHPFPEASSGHRAPTACRHMVSGTFHSPRRGSFHLSVTLLVPYRSLEVLSLGRWSSLFHTEFHEHRATLGHRTEGLPPVAYGAVTRYGGPFQVLRLGRPFWSPKSGPSTPPDKSGGLGWSPFARRYLGSRDCFPFLRLLRCFSSPGWPRRPMHSAAGEPGRLPVRLGFPHSGIPGSTLGWQLPRAYRSLLRPSSPSST